MNVGPQYVISLGFTGILCTICCILQFQANKIYYFSCLVFKYYLEMVNCPC